MGGIGSGRKRRGVRPRGRERGPAREDAWAIAIDRRAQSTVYRGYQLRVVVEGPGYRLYVNGERRGFYDRARDARTQGVWLAEQGNPKFVVETPYERGIKYVSSRHGRLRVRDEEE